MKSTSPRMKSILKFIADFKMQFKEIYGVTPHVFFEDEQEVVPPVSMKSLVAIGNRYIDIETYPQGLRTKCRKRELVFVRQCVTKLAKDMGYTHEKIGHHLGVDHSTCVHSCKTIEQFLEIGDPSTLLMINTLKDAIQDKFRDDGDVQSHLHSQANA